MVATSPLFTQIRYVNDIYCGSSDAHRFSTSVVAMQQQKLHG
jgi:hypothetical protein